MQILIAHHNDAGGTKENNQDSLSIQVAGTHMGTAVLALVCDGMGGLAKGELASAHVVRAFSSWFENELAISLSGDGGPGIRRRWDRLIRELNSRIAEYGRKHHVNTGTTLAALLIIGTKLRLIAHVGDTRVYRITEEMEQLTTDQTLVQHELALGKIGAAEAQTDPRRSVLLQCIGASKMVEPQFGEGRARAGEAYLLCSDGFRHEITAAQMLNHLRADFLTDEADMGQRLGHLAELCKQRGERDNITAILLKITDGRG